MTAASALVRSAVATSAAVLLVAHKDKPTGTGCPVLRRLWRVPEQAAPADGSLAYPDYSV
jgi:hypothetical protein